MVQTQRNESRVAQNPNSLGKSRTQVAHVALDPSVPAGHVLIIAPTKTPLLMARLRSSIRRSMPSISFRILHWTQFGEELRRRVFWSISGRKSFYMLKLVMENAGKVLTYSEIFHSLWGTDTGGNRAKLRVHIQELRKKLEPNPSKPRHILFCPISRDSPA